MPQHPLGRLGWQAHHHRSLPDGLVPARVIARDRGRVLLHDGAGEVSAPLAGRLQHDAATADDLPTAGDFVALGPGGAVEAVLARRGLLRRAGQLLAANVDVVLVAHAVAEDPHVARLPRLLALAADAGVPAVVLVTKADLLEDRPAAAESVHAATGGTVPVLLVAAATGEGLDAVRSLIGPGATAALVGATGAGKSTLVNALVGEERQRTGAVRSTDGRGRHVTVRRELVLVPGGGALVDMPGLRLVRVRGAADEAFSDVLDLAAGCRFRDCRHEDEPGCAVRAAVEAGGLDAARVTAWRRLTREAAYHAARDDERAARARARRHRAADTAYRRSARGR